MTAWLGVVSADHVARGVGLGIARIGHGSRSGLARMRPGDVLVYYSPRDTLGGAALQAFTAIGRVSDDEIWQADEGGYRPWCRRVAYDPTAATVPLADVRSELELTSAPNWGYRLRRGLVELSDHDLGVIATSMGAPTLAPSGNRS
jgi:hypothetical protein